MAKTAASERIRKAFGKRLRAARASAGFTQQEFSVLLGIKRDRYAKYELGHAEPPFSILERVSEVTRQSLDSLIGGRQVITLREVEKLEPQLTTVEVADWSDLEWLWKTDKQHLIVEIWHLHSKIPQTSSHQLPRSIAKTRWDFADANTKTDSSWQNHLEDLKAHRPFENFRYSIRWDGELKLICISGEPVFNQKGEFQGYIGRGIREDRDAIDLISSEKG